MVNDFIDASDPLLRRRLQLAEVSQPALARRGAVLLPKFPGMTYAPRPGGDGLRMRIGTMAIGAMTLTYIADAYATTATLAGDGLDKFCVSMVTQGRLRFTAPAMAQPIFASEQHGLVYRGRPGTQAVTSDDSARLNLWIPAQALEGRLEALLGDAAHVELAFTPVIDWQTGPGRSLRRLIRLLAEELREPDGLLAGDIGQRSLEDHLATAMLQLLPHNYSARLARERPAPTPGHLRRAETYMRANLQQPVTLQELASAAGCSIRTLQTAFRQWRNITPLVALRGMRLDAVHAAFGLAAPDVSITDTARLFGFGNEGRFARQYKRRFGQFPAETLRGRSRA